METMNSYPNLNIEWVHEVEDYASKLQESW